MNDGTQFMRIPLFMKIIAAFLTFNPPKEVKYENRKTQTLHVHPIGYINRLCICGFA